MFPPHFTPVPLSPGINIPLGTPGYPLVNPDNIPLRLARRADNSPPVPATLKAKLPRLTPRTNYRVPRLKLRVRIAAPPP